MENNRLRSAYRYCEWLTYRHYENFPVASIFLPADKRPYVAAVYSFARSADDFADEARYQGRSLELLDQWRKALWACVQSGAGGEGQGAGNAGNGLVFSGVPLVSHPIFMALADSIRACRLPVQFLDDLLTAFAMDVTKRRYKDWEELMTYCRYSANPVGRIVLAVFNYHDSELNRLSDCICTGLQLANHWQDLGIDWGKDLLYIPKILLDQYGVDEREIERIRTEGATDRFRALMKELVDRAEAFFREGESLPDRVSGSLRLELRLTVFGGRAILNQIRKSDYDVFRNRPIISAFDKARLLVRGLVS